MAETEVRRSKLAEKLARVARGTSSRIGFGAAAESPVPSLLLVVQLLPAPEVAAAALNKGADALLLDFGSDGQPTRRDIQAIHRIKPDIPLGLSLPADGIADCGRLGEWEEIDFCLAPIRQAPASILRSPTPKAFLSVDLRYPLQLARGASVLPIEGMVVENGKADERPLSLEDVVRYRILADIVPKPLIVAAGLWLQPDDLVNLRDQGIEGVLIAAAASVAETEQRVSAFRQAIEALGAAPARTRRGWGQTTVVANIGSFAAPPVAEPQEPEEPDEDE